MKNDAFTPTSEGSTMPTLKDSTMPLENQEEASAATPLDEGTHEEDDNKSNTKSAFWKYFQRFKVDGEWKAKCNHCGIVLAANPRSGTKSLKNHVQLYCKRLKQASSKQSTIGECFSKRAKLTSSDSFDQEISRKDLAHMIILHEYPLSIVDHIGMRMFISNLQPNFRCPTRNTIKKDIVQVYEDEKLNLMKTLDKTGGRVAVTTDMWTSNQRKGYMVVTTHFIDSSWRLQSRTLR